MELLLSSIRKCELCAAHLPLGPNPVVRAHHRSRVAIIGQAPGTKVHASGIPWDDPSGVQLRKWLGVTNEQFYDEKIFAIVPMGFCYPGKGISGDLPPRTECAPQWHQQLWDAMPNLELTLLIGQYAQRFYLDIPKNQTLTATVRDHFLDDHSRLPMPHPSPRNRFWLQQNPWFEKVNVPHLQKTISRFL